MLLSTFSSRVLLAACLLGLAALPARAGTIKYPKDKPIFTIEVPDAWTYEETEGNLHELTFKPDVGDFEIKILSLGKNPAGLKAILNEVVKATMANDKFTEPSNTEAQEVKTSAGMAVAIASAKCKIDGQLIIYSFAAFAPTKDNTCELAAYATSQEDSAKAEAAAEKMLETVKTLP